MKNQLELLDFDDMNWREFIPRHSGYIKDYEVHENFADDHLEEIFIGWKKEILDESIEAIGQIVRSEIQAMAAAEALLVHYYENYREKKAFLQHFEPLPVCLTETFNTADKITKLFEASGIDESWVRPRTPDTPKKERLRAHRRMAEISPSDMELRSKRPPPHQPLLQPQTRPARAEGGDEEGRVVHN